MRYRRFRYPVPGGGYRYPKRYPKWYTIDRVQVGELPGSLHAEYVRCGKASCKCSSGAPEDLHGPYWYRRWRDDDGRQHKTYVKRSELATVRAAIERRTRRLSRERAARDRHMRRGMGAGLPAHEWARTGSGGRRQHSDLVSSVLELSRTIDRLLQVR